MAFTAPAASGNGDGRKFAYMKAPGPIAGRWLTTCPYMNDLVVDIKVDGKSAIGRIAVLGQGARRGYTEGDEILHLSADDWGHWVGKLHWRSVSGMDRQDPINFVASASILDAIITTDECFKGMPHAPESTEQAAPVRCPAPLVAGAARAAPSHAAAPRMPRRYMPEQAAGTVRPLSSCRT